MLIVGIVATSCPAFFWSKYKNTRASKICIFCLWGFFVPISAYYKGALKMFFNSEVSLPFEKLDQVLDVFPSWNLIMLKGMENHYKPLADQVCYLLFLILSTTWILIHTVWNFQDFSITHISREINFRESKSSKIEFLPFLGLWILLIW